MVDDKIKIYKINEDGSCKFLASTGFRGSKVSFSYPQAGKEPSIVFTVDENGPKGFKNSAVVFDINTKKAWVVSREEDIPLYPGFNRDGHIQYKSKREIITIDPNQTAENRGPCIPVTSSSGSKSTSLQKRSGKR